jgi:hypothetical protein
MGVIHHEGHEEQEGNLDHFFEKADPDHRQDADATWHWHPANDPKKSRIRLPICCAFSASGNLTHTGRWGQRPSTPDFPC